MYRIQIDGTHKFSHMCMCIEFLIQVPKQKNRGQELNTNFSLKIFPISRPKFGFPGFRRTYRTFWPPPHHVEDPHPTLAYPDQKVWVWVPFSSLRNAADLQENSRRTLSPSKGIAGTHRKSSQGDGALWGLDWETDFYTPQVLGGGPF